MRPPTGARFPGGHSTEGTGISGLASCPPQILISADDEMEESDAEEDLRRPVKKKHRFGLPV